jgi:WD40 repeat protein
MLLNLADGRTVRSFPLSQRWDGPSAFSPDGKLAVSVLMAGERPLAIPRLALWEVASGRVERVLERKGMVPVAVAFTRDGQRLLAGCSEMLLEWDVSSGKEVGAVSVQGVGVAFSPDHALMLSRAGGDSIMYERCRPGMTIQVWDTAQMKLFKTLTAPPGPQR